MKSLFFFFVGRYMCTLENSYRCFEEALFLYLLGSVFQKELRTYFILRKYYML